MNNHIKTILSNTILLITLLGFKSSTYAQDPESLKMATLKLLRTYRNQLNGIEGDTAVQSLLTNLNRVINITRDINGTDTVRLKEINEYWSAVKRDEQYNDINLINEDLRLKIAYFDTIAPSMNIEPGSSFFRQEKVTVEALFSTNTPNTNRYRLYWSSGFGKSVADNIKKRAYQGQSNQLANPFVLEFTVPAIVTFWLENVETRQLYQADAKYYRIMPYDKHLQVYFSLYE